MLQGGAAHKSHAPAPHTAIFVSRYCYICAPYCYTCGLILLYMCPHSADGGRSHGTRQPRSRSTRQLLTHTHARAIRNLYSSSSNKEEVDSCSSNKDSCDSLSLSHTHTPRNLYSSNKDSCHSCPQELQADQYEEPEGYTYIHKHTYAYMCVCVHTCLKNQKVIHIYTNTHDYMCVCMYNIYIYIYT